MNKILLYFLLLFGFLNTSFSQDCTTSNDSGYSYVALNNGFIEEASSFVEPGEYMTISNIVTDAYVFAANHTSGSTEQDDYITISDTSNNIIKQGVSPLSHTFLSAGTYRIHVSLDSSCTTAVLNTTVTLLNETVAPTTCQEPENPTVSYRSDVRIDFSWEPPTLGGTPLSYDWKAVPNGGDPDVDIVDSGNVMVTSASATGLSPSTFYWFYIRSKCGANGDSEWFRTPSLLSTNAGPPPSNDICSGSTFIIEETGKDINSATAHSGTVLNTAQTDVEAENCDLDKTDNARDDIWYKFIAQTTDINIVLDPMFDGVLSLFSDCDQSSLLACSDIDTGTTQEQITYGSLTIGDTYYFRVWSQGFSASNPNFTVKLYSSTSTTDGDGDGYSNDPDVDCNDGNDAIYPGAPETPDNGIDEDCDGLDLQTWYLDSDGDNYGDNNNSVLSNTQPTDYVANDSDCDDSNSSINPDATEVCNGVDDDCDGLVDDLDPSLDTSTGTTWYEDADSDGFGDPESSIMACDQPSGYVNNNSDICLGYDDSVDTDGDGVPDGCDNCPDDANADQADTNNNGLGDVCDPSLSINDFNFSSLKVFPNPFYDEVNVYLPIDNLNIDFEISIYDLYGRRVIIKEELKVINNIIRTQNLSKKLNRGLYLLKIRNKSDNLSVVKSILKHQ